MKKQDIDIRIAGLKEVDSATGINRWELMRHDGSPVNIRLHAAYRRVTTDRLALRLEATYTSTRALVVRKLLTFTMEAVFDVDCLDEIATRVDNEIILPRELLLVTMNVAIGGLRGMLAAKTAGTLLVNYPLPLLDIGSLVSNLTDAPANARGRLPEITIAN